MCFLFFFNDTATTEIYTYGHTLSLHDALPIFFYRTRSDLRELWHLFYHCSSGYLGISHNVGAFRPNSFGSSPAARTARSEEHTSELQSLMRISYAVFCLKKKNNNKKILTQNIQHETQYTTIQKINNTKQ